MELKFNRLRLKVDSLHAQLDELKSDISVMIFILIFSGIVGFIIMSDDKPESAYSECVYVGKSKQSNNVGFYICKGKTEMKLQQDF